MFRTKKSKDMYVVYSRNRKRKNELLFLAIGERNNLLLPQAFWQVSLGCFVICCQLARWNLNGKA